MKKYLLGFAAFTVTTSSLIFAFGTLAQTTMRVPVSDTRVISRGSETDTLSDDVVTVSPNLVISQIQMGTATQANDEFVELHNISAAPVDLNGFRVVYRSSTGTTDVGPFAAWTTSTVVQPGQYYLIASTLYTGARTPDITYNTSTCTCSMSATAGGLAIRNGAQNTGTVIDAVGWGAASNVFFEGTRTVAPGNGNGQARVQNGCQDTDNNASDFSTLTPSAPRNTTTTAFVCSGSGSTLFAALAANPNNLAPLGSTLLTVTVVPATTPPSTNIQVTGNLTQIGGSSLQIFADDGLNGDATSGDNVFSYLATVPADTSGGIKNITAIASDAESRVVNLTQNITINAPLPDEDPLLFGNPSNATSDVNNPLNYLMIKPQYSLSYNRDKGTPNWTAWRLDSSWLGGTNRQDDFRPDTTLPGGWYQVQASDYDFANTGYQRGHMCPSGDRTNSVPNNSATFLMTNMVPQISDNNTGPWEDLESYCRTLVGQGKELYIISGPQGLKETIANGHVTAPLYTWKIVLVLPNGTNDLSRVGKQTRVFGVIMSNVSITQSAPWRNYRVTVDQVETLTGYDFFSNLSVGLQARLESKADTQ